MRKIRQATIGALLMGLLPFALAGQSPAALPTVEGRPQLLALRDSAQVLKSAGHEVAQAQFLPGQRYDFWQLIQGNVPGLLAARPGGDPNAAYSVQLRGIHSAIYGGINGGPGGLATLVNRGINLVQPLVVVDGFPGADPQSIDPYDIASVTILRDAASAASYGLRGANGVVEIKTHRPQAKAFQIQYQAALTTEKAATRHPALDAATFRGLVNDPNYAFFNPNNDLGQNTDWFAAITRPAAYSQAHQLSGTGGLGTAHYRVAINYRRVQGIGLESGFEQVNALLRWRQTLLKDRLEYSLGWQTSTRDREQSASDLFRAAAIVNPTAPIRDAADPTTGGYYQSNRFAYYNPVAALAFQEHLGNQDWMTGQGQLTYHLRPWLRAHGQAAWQRTNDWSGQSTQREDFAFGRNVGGWAERATMELTNFFWQSRLEGRWQRGMAQLQANLGYDQQVWETRGTTRTGFGFGNQPASFEALHIPGVVDSLQETNFQAQDVLKAWWGSARLTWRERWFVHLSLRTEGSNRLPAVQRWNLFPAIQLGGDLVPYRADAGLNRLGFVLGWGQTGNLPPKNYATHLLLNPSQPYFSNGQYQQGLDYTLQANPDLGAERRSEWNLHLEASLANSRLQLQLDAYRSRSTDLLLMQRVPDNGFAEMAFLNSAGLTNQGLELALNAQVVAQKSWEWQSSLVFSTNQTELTALTAADASLVNGYVEAGAIGGPGICCVTTTRMEPGAPVGRFYGLVANGIDANGNWQTRDGDGDGQACNCSADFVALGQGLPQWMLGWNNRWQIGRFDLGMFWRGLFGHRKINTYEVFNGAQQGLTRGFNISEQALEGERAQLLGSPQLVDRFFERAGFLRLDHLTLGYTFAQNKKRVGQRLRLYLSGQNLVTLTPYTGIDAEPTLANLGNRLAPGIETPNYTSEDPGRVPYLRGWTLGLRWGY